MANEDWEVPVIIVIVVLTIIVWLYLRAGFYLVRHAEVMIVERLGKYHATCKAGVYWLWPGIDAPRRVHWRFMQKEKIMRTTTDHIDTREHILDFPSAHQVVTADNVQLKVDALCYFRITDARTAVYQIQNLPDAIEVLTQSTLRDIIARMSLDDTFSNRETLNSRLLMKIQPDCERWGVTITRVEIFNILPPGDIQSAMENQIKSERMRRSTVLKADGERESAVINSRGDAARMVLVAEGARAAVVLRAEGSAAARKISAEAEAASLSDIKAAVASSGVRAVDYMTAINYLEGLQSISSGSSTRAVLLPSETMDSVAELIKLNEGDESGRAVSRK